MSLINKKMITLPSNIQTGCIQYLNLACSLNMFRLEHYRIVAEGMERIVKNEVYVQDMIRMKSVCEDLIKTDLLRPDILEDVQCLKMALTMFIDAASLAVRPCGMWYMAALSNN